MIGYYTLAAWTVAHQEFGGGWPKRNAPDPVPVILLGRLAVDLSAQRLGLGRLLPADALATAQIGAAVIGARALVTEAIDDHAAFYTDQGLWRSAARPDLFPAPLRPARA